MTKGKYLGEFEQLVLLAVARLDGEAYGMSIRREIEDQSDRHVAIGAVYATLERLHDKGYVRGRKGDTSPERDGRARKFFAVTAAGAKVLENARELQERMWDGLELSRRRSGA
jgi:PadR family transcriptional regulator PadR